MRPVAWIEHRENGCGHATIERPEQTAALVSDPEYRGRVRVLESALWGHPYLICDEAVLLIAAS
jgi:hypothetical protein